MVTFDVVKFLREGGTKVATTPKEAQEVFSKTELGRIITTTKRTGRVSTRGGGGAFTPSPTFSSTLLSQTFGSSAARASAESAFLAERARAVEAEAAIARARGVERQRLLEQQEQAQARQRRLEQQSRVREDMPLGFATEVKKKKELEGLKQSLAIRLKILRTKKQRGTITKFRNSISFKEFKETSKGHIQ